MDSQTLVTQLQQLDLLPVTPSFQAELARLLKRFPDARSLSRELLNRNLITPYQANQLLTGKGETLAVGPYRLEERLGEGASAQVFKAHHFRMGRLVALKIIRPERLQNNPNALERFMREAQAAAALSHPNVVRAYDVGQAGEVYYFAMQFLDGVDLHRLVKREGPLAVPRACDYILQAAQGLQHVHENNMVHRDIKPSNLMVARNSTPGENTSGSGNYAPASPDASSTWGRVKILDLGLARLDEDPTAPSQQVALTKIGTVMGTPDYMAPEQALHSRNADIRSDIYSLGCTFYFALTGKSPFAGGDAIEKMLKHQLETPPPIEELRPDLPGEVEIILNKMMAKKKDDRYQTPREVVEALQAVLSSPPPRAVPLAAVPSMELPESPHPDFLIEAPEPEPTSPAGPPKASPVAPPVAEESPFTQLDPVQLPFTPLVRVPSRHSEWGLWIILGGACVFAIISLVVALIILLR